MTHDYRLDPNSPKPPVYRLIDWRRGNAEDHRIHNKIPNDLHYADCVCGATWKEHVDERG